MGVYIKGMEMPKSCYMCDFCADFVQEDGIETLGCRRLKRAVPFRAGFKFADCPLVPTPPHGRLIDADALTEIISKVIGINASIDQRNEATDQERRCLWWFEEQVNIAPTIIPAEEGET